MLDHTNVDNIKYLSTDNLKQITGGVKISGTLINAFTSAIKTLLDLGRSVGTAIRRLKSKKGICSL